MAIKYIEIPFDSFDDLLSKISVLGVKGVKKITMTYNLEELLRKEKMKEFFRKELFKEELKAIRGGKKIDFDKYNDEQIIWILQALLGEDKITGFVHKKKK